MLHYFISFVRTWHICKPIAANDFLIVFRCLFSFFLVSFSWIPRCAHNCCFLLLFDWKTYIWNRSNNDVDEDENSVLMTNKQTKQMKFGFYQKIRKPSNKERSRWSDDRPIPALVVKWTVAKVSIAVKTRSLSSKIATENEQNKNNINRLHLEILRLEWTRLNCTSVFWSHCGGESVSPGWTMTKQENDSRERKMAGMKLF